MKRKRLCNYILLIAFTLTLHGFFEASASDEYELCSASQPIDQQYGNYAYKILKPILLYLNQLQTKLNDNNVDALIKQNEHLKAENNNLKDKLELYNSIIADLRESKKNLLRTNDQFYNEITKLQAQGERRANTNTNENQAKPIDELTNNFASTTKSLSNELTKLQTQTATEAQNIELLFKTHINNAEKCEMDRRDQTELLTKVETCAQEVLIQSNQTNELQGQIEKLQEQIKNYVTKIEELEKRLRPNNSCKPFAHNPGEHEIQLPGLLPFKVLCSDDSRAGSGWTIIQQRINGKEDFERDWNTYRDGFGSFDGDFFLGLNKIHHITHSQRHELYIYMQKFNDEWFSAHNDNFTVGSEDDLFELQSLGNYTGTNYVENWMGYNEHMKFTTSDRDNDIMEDGNCATDEMSGGWWYISCGNCNLNGKYFPTEVHDSKSPHWFGLFSLKKIQMLIRPIN